MSTPGRKELLCAQAAFAFTGIDFIRVNPADHRDIAVFFVVDPFRVPGGSPDFLVREVNTATTEFGPEIVGHEDGSTIGLAEVPLPATNPAWGTMTDASGRDRAVLRILFAAEGDFQTYRLTLTDRPEDGLAQRLDPFCDALDFSFKQPCPQPFDCRPVKACPPQTVADYPVDYLARDFESFRRALLAYASDRYPDWDAQVPADFGGMVAELFAALGDEFSYIQDRFQREGYLSTLTQRRSFDQLARLVDYRLDPGQAAGGLVVMRLYAGRVQPNGAAVLTSVHAGARVWADQEDRPPVPFEVGESLHAMIADHPDYAPHADDTLTTDYALHSRWTDLPAYLPDPQVPCLPIGAREMFVAHAGLITGPAPAEAIAGDLAGYWVGRQLLIETRPDAPDAPIRRWLVEIDEPLQAFEDPLTGTDVVRIHWREKDALPFEVDQTRAFVSANLVPVRAGMTVVESFVTGPGGDPDLPRSIERQGPVRWDARPAIHRHTLAATVARGLGWQRLTDAAGAVRHAPDAVLTQTDPDTGTPIAAWSVGSDALDLAETDEALSVERGRFDTVQSLERNGIRHVHRDYVDDSGFTLRFGDGVFGRQPTTGDTFRTTYRTGPGRAANVPEDTISRLTEPEGLPAPLFALPGEVLSLSNPFALTDGRDGQPLELARRIAPAAYKALVFRAVRDADYRAQAERLDWVQQAGAVTRWTGAWASTFVSADPKGAFEISGARLAELRARLGAVRQVGRCVIAKQPVFQPVDLRIAVCVRPGVAFGDVSRRVIDALSPKKGGFFHPDRFSFGDPLRRPALEAAIACVDGVRAVMAIEIRLRGLTGYVAFVTPEITVADNRILKLENDPNRPGQGSIRIYEDEIPALEGAS
jgi:hypothetical protein